ncbi:LysR substrate-binding domain-containing protein [Marinomonas epiphytica]
MLLNNLKGTPRGKLRVDAVSPFLYHQIIPHIAAFQAAYPDIQLELISSENIIDLIEKKTDVAIRIGQLADSNLHARRIGFSKLHIVGSPSYFDRFGKPLNVTDLAKHQIIGFADSAKLNNWPAYQSCTNSAYFMCERWGIDSSIGFAGQWHCFTVSLHD